VPAAAGTSIVLKLKFDIAALVAAVCFRVHSLE
jgi:hypothetical protein